VAFGARGEIYVGDAGDGSVKIFDGSGRATGILGRGAGELAMPNEIAVDATDGTVFVVDSRRDQVRAFAAAGAPLLAFGATGKALGQLSFPTGIHLDGPADRVYVVDHDNARVELFSRSGAYVSMIGGTYSAAPGGLVRPQGIARDRRGRLYVADAFVGRVQIFDPNGAHLGYVGTAGRGSGQLALPSDVVVDAFGRLLVTSYDTGRILVYGVDDFTMPPDVLAAEVSIEPTVIQRASSGRFVTAYVELPGHDVSTLAPGAVLRTGRGEVAASRQGELGDHDADGVPDLALKFPREALVALLGPPGQYEVKLAGRLISGEELEGTAVVELAGSGLERAGVRR
jgi:DNA-binding beta-propeller fold protein YncE